MTLRSFLAGAGLSLCLATACGHPMQRKLEGRWLGQSVENVDDADFAAASGWARGLSMEFAGSSVTIAVPAEEPRSGKYKIVSVHNGEVQLAISDERGKTDKTKLKIDDEQSLRWLIGDGRAVLLRREN
jgi:hypothetical protein